MAWEREYVGEGIPTPEKPRPSDFLPHHHANPCSPTASARPPPDLSTLYPRPRHGCSILHPTATFHPMQPSAVPRSQAPRSTLQPSASAGLPPPSRTVATPPARTAIRPPPFTQPLATAATTVARTPRHRPAPSLVLTAWSQLLSAKPPQPSSSSTQQPPLVRTTVSRPACHGKNPTAPSTSISWRTNPSLLRTTYTNTPVDFRMYEQPCLFHRMPPFISVVPSRPFLPCRTDSTPRIVAGQWYGGTV